MGHEWVCTDMDTDTDPGNMSEGLGCAGMGMRRGVMRQLRDRTDTDMSGGDIRAEVSRRVAEWPSEAEEHGKRFECEGGRARQCTSVMTIWSG